MRPPEQAVGQTQNTNIPSRASRLLRAEGFDDIHVRCAEGGEDAADKTHDQREGEPLRDDAGRHGEAEGKLRKGLEIERRYGKELHEGGEEKSRDAAYEA